MCRRIGFVRRLLDSFIHEPRACWSSLSDILTTCIMVIFSQSKNLSEGKFTRPPDERELKPDPPKRQPLVKPKLQSPLNETNEIELPPWLRGIQAQPVSTSPGRESAVKFVLPKQKSPRKKRRRNATLYDAVAGTNSQSRLVLQPANYVRSRWSTRLQKEIRRLEEPRHSINGRTNSCPRGSPHPPTTLPK